MADKLRSIVFNFFLIFGSLFMSVILVWAFIFPPRRCAEIVGTIYGGFVTLIEKTFMNLHLEIRGMENLPQDQLYIIAAKHQSAFETLKIPFMGLFKFPAIILKKELTMLPFWGMYPVKMGSIAIDRSAGTKALRSIVNGCEKALQDGRNIIIFPQGTRIPPGDKGDYKSGLAKIYKDLEVPIIPMALNSGVYWGKNKFFKRSGTIVFEFLPMIEPGMKPMEMMKALEAAIEPASDRLVAEAKAILAERDQKNQSNQ